MDIAVKKYDRTKIIFSGKGRGGEGREGKGATQICFVK